MKKVKTKIKCKFKRHPIKFCIITVIIINSIYFWSDYFNIPSKLINVNNINLSLLIAVLNNSVTVSLFIITYFVINRKNLENKKNQRKIARSVLINVCSKCLFIKENSDFKNMLNEISNYKEIEKQQTIEYYKNLPFQYEKLIIEFAKTGVINAEIYDGFYNIKDTYQFYISRKIERFVTENIDIDDGRPFASVYPMLEQTVREFANKVNNIL